MAWHPDLVCAYAGRQAQCDSVTRARESLEARDVRVHIRGVKAVDGVDLTLRRGEILGLIGPNGAGKTTLVNVLSGFQRPTAGRVVLDGEDITTWAPAEIARAGLVRTFQDVRLFPALTVFENVEAGAVSTGASRRQARASTLASSWPASVSSTAPVSQPAALPHGDERRLAIARALRDGPVFLLLDEPAAGLDEGESDELVAALAAIRDDVRVGLLVIEHDMRLIMQSLASASRCSTTARRSRSARRRRFDAIRRC